MKNLNVYSAFLDLSHSIKIYYVLAFGAFFSVLSFILFNDILTALVFVATTIAGFYLLSRPPKKIEFDIQEEGLNINGELLELKNIIEWAVVDLGDVWEFVIKTDKYIHQFYYFYTVEKEGSGIEIAKILGEILPYNEKMPSRNFLHSFLRKLGLK